MAPIDPRELLNALGPLLTKDGSLDGQDNAKTFYSLMKDGSRLVSRCIYINILKATGNHSNLLLDTLLESGVWDTLNTWLQDAKESDNIPFLIELLLLYKSLPVTVDVLKKNNAAKTIKQLCKSDDDDMKTLASSIVDNWMMKIRGKTNVESGTASGNEKVKDNKKEESTDSKSLDEGEMSPSVGENTENGDDSEIKSPSEKKRRKHHHSSQHHHHHHQKDHQKDNQKEHHRDRHKPKPKPADSTNTSSKIMDITTENDSTKLATGHQSVQRTNSTDNERTPIKLIISKGQVQNSVNPSVTDDKKRAKTVKVRPQKFRSTGLQEDITPLPQKKSVIETKNVPPKRSNLSYKSDKTVEPPEKKTRPYVSTSQSTPAPTPSSLSPSISSPTEIHGKIRIIPAKPLKVEMKDSSGFMDALIATPVLSTLKKKKKPSSRPSTSPTATTMPSLVVATTTGATTIPVATTTTSQAPVPPTSPTMSAKRLPSLPSFYRDTLETNETESKIQRSPSPPKLIQQPPVPEYHPPPDATPDAGTSDKSHDSATDDADKSNSANQYSKKRRKTVSWAAEHNLRQIFYFEMDETERENVNKTRDFAEMKKQEAQVERKTMESAKRMSHDRMGEEVEWYSPELIDDVVQLCESGKDSVERDIQQKRESSVLQALYFSRHMLPDSASEPDLEEVQQVEPTLIPLEDDNPVNETTHTYDNTDVNNAPPMAINSQYTPNEALPSNQPGTGPVIGPGQMLQPPMGQPPMGQPHMGQPPNVQPSMGQPPMGQPSMGQPPMGQPPMMPHNMAPPPQHASLPPDIVNLLSSLTQGNFDPTAPANSLQQMTSLLNSEQPAADDNVRHIQQMLEPYKQQLLSYMNHMSNYNQMYNMGQPPPYNNMFNPMMGNMQPAFNPMMGPRPQMPMFHNNNNGSDEWSENHLRGGPPPFMRKRGRGFPNRGFRGGRGRGGNRGGYHHNSDWKPLCRHIDTPQGCKFGSKCQYYHPANKNNSSNGPSS